MISGQRGVAEYQSSGVWVYWGFVQLEDEVDSFALGTTDHSITYQLVDYGVHVFSVDCVAEMFAAPVVQVIA